MRLRRQDPTLYGFYRLRHGYSIGIDTFSYVHFLNEANESCSFGQWPLYTVRPILYPIEDENVLLSFSRRPLVGSASSPRSPGIPSLSDSHVEAINVLQAAAEKHTLSMKLQRGDILFWNNLALLHSRKGFTDSPDSRRHLIRLWLRNGATEKNWSIPEDLQASWKDAFDHAGRQSLWPIEPIKDRDYICNQQRSSGHA
jgi:hypothetical protein